MMNVRTLDAGGKLDILARSARYDVCLASCNANARGGSGRVRDPSDPVRKWLYPAEVPGKGQVHILKVLQTNVCTNSCSYCSLSCRRDSVRRVSFSPDELASVYMGFVRRRLVHGIFLSSGVAMSAERSMERMVATADILRNRYGYGGYIHLKVLPGISDGLLLAASSLADRLSMNLEAPTRGQLSRIAPEKDFVRDLVGPMRKTAEILRGGSRAKSQTTQFVVGASDETDLDILQTTDWLYRDLHVFRAYFSAFQPVDEGQGEGSRQDIDALNARESTFLREHRLYQVDFLLRGYGFRFPDLVFDGEGNIPSRVDPKTAYAMLHPELFPVDVNEAPLELLLRVPGIGPLSAKKIVEARVKEPLRSIEDLACTGAWTSHAGEYVEFAGKRDAGGGAVWRQRFLFENAPPAGWRTGLAPKGGAVAAASPDTGRPGAGGGEAGDALTPRPTYEYPAQKGKPLNYVWKKSQERLWCR